MDHIPDTERISAESLHIFAIYFKLFVLSLVKIYVIYCNAFLYFHDQQVSQMDSTSASYLRSPGFKSGPGVQFC
jgi:hypothetical protein